MLPTSIKKKFSAMWFIFISYTESEVDGETLMELSVSGTMEQLASVGLNSLKKQMLLKKLLRSSSSTPATSNVNAPGPSGLQTSTDYSSVEPQDRKLTTAELKRLPQEDRALYLMM